MTIHDQPENSTNMLTLADIPYNPNYKLNQASASQIQKGLCEMAARIGEPQNDYQRELYPVLKMIVKKMTTRYEELLVFTTDIERDVRKFNLHGYSGRIKSKILTKGVKFNINYAYANFGDYFKTLAQRLKYLVERQFPQRYITNMAEGVAYTELKTELQAFLKFLQDDVEPMWNAVVASARAAGGDSVQDNLRKREEKKIASYQKSAAKIVADAADTATAPAPVQTTKTKTKSNLNRRPRPQMTKTKTN